MGFLLGWRLASSAVQADHSAFQSLAVTIVGRVPNARAIAQLGPVELAGTFWVVQNPIIRLLIISPWTADIILLCLDGVVVS